MRIMTCNIRTALARDGSDDWQYRADLCADVIGACNADIICCQEAQRTQMDDLLERLAPHYDWHSATDEPSNDAPANPILFRSAAFARVAAGAFWLSETPHVIGSRSWDSRCVRYANWMRLVETASGAEFAVFNTHLDHVSAEARVNQARVLSEAAAAYDPDYPRLLTGDMNAGPGTPPIEAYLAAGWIDTWSVVHGNEGPGRTFHAYHGEEHTEEHDPIDWIMKMGNVTANAAEVVRDSRNGRYPSDHYFLWADVEFPPRDQ